MSRKVKVEKGILCLNKLYTERKMYRYIKLVKSHGTELNYSPSLISST